MDRAIIQELMERVNSVLDAETVLFKINYRVESIEQSGVSIKSFCPIHKETMIRSLMIDPSKRRFRCNYFNCPGNKGGTFWDLYRLATGSNEEEAVRFWCRELGIGEEYASALGTGLEQPEAAAKDIPRFSHEVNAPQVKAAPEPDQPVHEMVDFVSSSVPVSSEEQEPEAHEESAQQEPREAETAVPAAGEADYRKVFEEGIAAFESNKYNAALDLLRSALEIAGTPDEKVESEVMVARCLIHLKKTDEALGLLQKAMDRPGIADVARKEILYQMAEAWERCEQPEKAVEILRGLTQRYGAYRDADNRIKRLQGRSVEEKSPARDRRISFI